MQFGQVFLRNMAAISLVAGLASYASRAQAANFKVLHDFPANSNTANKGSDPQGNLLIDSVGNLYGITYDGGMRSGTVYRLNVPKAGAARYTLSLLHVFKQPESAFPMAGLLANSAGELFGTTGGDGGGDYGSVFRLQPPPAGSGSWKKTVLNQFEGDPANGAVPNNTLIADSAGNLYGTTLMGGANNFGTVYEVLAPSSGRKRWTTKVLYSFDGTNGSQPMGTLLSDKNGNLYGTTRGGGDQKSGTVYELSPPQPGETKWTYTVLVSFGGEWGNYPNSGLIADKSGNLYGTAGGYYPRNSGTVFIMNPPANGSTAWAFHLIYQFIDPNNSGEGVSSLLLDSEGRLFGTTAAGGAKEGGKVFVLNPPKALNGVWTERDLASFDGTTGYQPESPLVQDAAGNFYGTTSIGGPDGGGTLYKLTIPNPF